MNRFICALLFGVSIGLLVQPNLRAEAILFESGTLGATGLARGDVPAANVSDTVFPGVRFELKQPVITSQIGGHFVGSVGTSDTFFGALVKLDDGDDFPDSGDLSTADMLGHTSFTFPESSAEIFGDLQLPLNPGWYALIFGSGLFGASGDGAMPLNNPDIGSSTYIGFQPGAVNGWVNLTNPLFHNFRFVVKGYLVPEPASVLILLAFLVTAASRRGNALRGTFSL